MSDQRILRYQVVLLENPGLTVPPCEVLNPATLLATPEGSLPFTLAQRPWTTVQNPERDCWKIIWYTDGSSFVLDGKRRARYAVVSNFEIIEAKPLPPAVKVPGHDSWIHYSQVKPWKKTEEDTQYTCEPLGDLRYLFRTTNECHSILMYTPKTWFLGIKFLRIALKRQHSLAGIVLQNRQEIDLLIPEQGGT